MSLERRLGRLRGAGACPGEWLALRRGGADDLRRLLRFHYRAAMPAAVCRVLVLDGRDGPVACLAVSRPTLNAWWRAPAWPDIGRASRQEAAVILNQDVRTISRVVIDPRWRGIGLAVRLVRSYLAEAETERTEAVAAMGRACPFFERAGMATWKRPDCGRDRRLRRVLRDLGLRPAALLRPRRSLRAGLRSWANDSRATRGMNDEDVARAAARALLAPPIAYTHGPPARADGAEGGPWPLSLTASGRPTICTEPSRGTLESASLARP